jgi:hypothetical protein
MIKSGHCLASELAMKYTCHAQVTRLEGTDMASLSALFSGLSRGLVMDELEAWSDETVEPALHLVPAQRPASEPEVDLTDARFDLDD